MTAVRVRAVLEWRSLLRAVLEWQSLLADVAGSCHATFVCLFVCASPHEAVSLVVADHRKPKNGETHIWLHGSQLALEVARLMGTANYRETFGADWSTGTPLCAATKPAATASATTVDTSRHRPNRSGKTPLEIGGHGGRGRRSRNWAPAKQPPPG